MVGKRENKLSVENLYTIHMNKYEMKILLRNGLEMDNTILVAIIAGAFSVIACITTYIVARYNFNKPNDRKILEDELNKVIAPIHKLLNFYVGGDSDDAANKIKEIIDINYYMISPVIVENFLEFFHCEKRKLGLGWDSTGVSCFKRLIDLRYDKLRRKLGYTKLRYPNKSSIEETSKLNFLLDIYYYVYIFFLRFLQSIFRKNLITMVVAAIIAFICCMLLPFLIGFVIWILFFNK